MGLPTNYYNNGVDIGLSLVEKAYLIDNYPYLVDTFRFAGLWLWGNNNYGNLGDATVVSKSSPIQTISGGANWKQISSGSGHVAGIKTDNTLWLWGNNQYFLGNGQLGDNTTVNKSSPVQTISGGTNWQQVSCGGFHTSAIKTDGTLWGWGLNNIGQLGNNTTVTRSSPVQVITGGTNWKRVDCGGFHTTAIKTDGTLWLWGYNDFGQLGNNTITSRSSPIQTIAGGTNWKQVACGIYYTAAIKTDGTLWLWGQNNYGQLGNNSITDRSSPVQTIAGGTNWKQVACGTVHTAAIKTDGTLWLWGHNAYGQLGDNTTIHRSSPVQVITGGTNWKGVVCGGYHTMAIKTDGTLWSWGQNNYGQTGDGTVILRSSPVQTVSGGTNWRQIAASGRISIAIRDNSEDLL